MEDLKCPNPNCQAINDYYTELKSNNNVARCLQCDTFIKNLPQGGEPTFFFGKYKDKKVREVEDMPYLKWALQNIKLTATMKAAIQSQISRFEHLAK